MAATVLERPAGRAGGLLPLTSPLRRARLIGLNCVLNVRMASAPAGAAGGVAVGGGLLGASWAEMAAKDRKLDKALRSARIATEFLPPTSKPKKRLHALLAFTGR